MSIRTTIFAFASLVSVAAAPLAAFADTMPLPGQPGADTSLGQELRAQPYTDAERQAIVHQHQQRASNYDVDNETGHRG